MSTVTFPHEYRVPVLQDHIRTIKDPHFDDIVIIHALTKVRDLPTDRSIPDKINPRCHEDINMDGRIPTAIRDSLVKVPERFHLLNRGCLILAKKAWYDNRARMLHFIVESEDENGMVDGATTDRVLDNLKKQVSNAAFATLKEDEIPDYFKQAYVHIEIIAGEFDQDLRIDLADARNTSAQVKEFSLQDLGGHFDWLKDILENSKFHGKIRYRENDPKPVDIRAILALLTMFHPNWQKENRDPVVAYTGKGVVLDLFTKEDWRSGYEALAPVVLDILELYDYVHVNFQKAYKHACAKDGAGAKFGKRKEVRYIDKPAKAKVLTLTGGKTQYVLTDGWLYPVLASLRMLLIWPKGGRCQVKWMTNPFKFFDQNGPELVSFLVDRSEELGRNPNATGKSKGVWLGLRDKVENRVLRERVNQLESN
jgi:hypothetical protein